MIQSSISTRNHQCILEIDPEEMPSQVQYDLDYEVRQFRGWGAYMNILNGYLGKHFDLMYSEVPDYQFGALAVRDPGYHLLIGPTVRTEAHRLSGRRQVNHVVVAKNGESVWDVHPSRAGLTNVDKWGVLAPLTERIRHDRFETGQRIMADDSRDDRFDYQKVFIDCLCPGCCAERGDP